MDSVELLPCPFCGPGNSVVSLWLDDVAHRWRVGCGRCGCSTGIHPRDKTEAPAIAAWNTRAALAPAGVGERFCQMDWMPRGVHLKAWTCRECGNTIEREGSSGHPHVRCTARPDSVSEAADAARWRQLMADTNHDAPCDYPCLRDDLVAWIRDYDAALEAARAKGGVG
jgi:hypothetical protein